MKYIVGLFAAFLSLFMPHPVIQDNPQPEAPLFGGSSAFVQATTTNGSGTAPSVNYLTTPTQGNLLVTYVWSASSGAITMTSSGWSPLKLASAGGGSSQRACRMFYKIAGASESKTITAASGSNAWAIAAAEYTNPNTTTAVNVEDNQANASGVAWTPIVTATSGPDVIVVAGVGVRTSATWSNEQINLSTVGVTSRATRSVALASIDFLDSFVDSVSGTYQASSTPSSSAVGCAAIALFQQAAAGGGAASGFQERVTFFQ